MAVDANCAAITTLLRGARGATSWGNQRLGGVDSLVLVGASGRVGRLVRAAWPIASPTGITLMSQFRQDRAMPDGDDAFAWDPLVQSPPPRLHACGQRAVMVVLAGVTPGPDAPLERNTQIALGCIAAARNLGIGRVLIASSSAVYGPGRGRPLAETDVPGGFNAYGAAKLAMETAIGQAAGDIDVCCLRIGNVLGADALLLNASHASPDNPLLLDRFEDGGGPVRSYIDPWTLAGVLVSLSKAEGRLPFVLNIASPHPVAMQAIAKAAGIPWRWQPASPSAHQTIVLDCTKLQAIHAFDADDSSPARMLARLDQVRPKI